MADNLNDNLKLNLEINNALKKRVELINTQTKALKGQTSIAWEAYAAVEKLSAEELNKKILDTKKVIGGLNETVKDSEDNFTNMTKAMTQAALGTKNLNKNVAVFGASFAAIKTASTVFDFVALKLVSLGKFIAITIKGFVGISKSIVSIPFKLMRGLIDFSYELGVVDVITRTFEDVRKVMGDLQKGTGALIKESITPMQREFNKLAVAGHGFSAVFGYGREGVANAIRFNTELFEKMNGAAFELRREINANIATVAIYQKGLGMTAEQQATIIQSTRSQGKDALEYQQEFSKFALQMGDRFNFSAKEMGQSMAQMSADVGNYGTLTTKQLSQITVYTKQLGIETRAMLGLITKYDDFESAAQSAAMLNQTFGMQVDVLKMLREEDPAARLAQLQRSFQATGRSYEQLSRAERKRLADLAGLDDKSAAFAFSQQGLAASYEDVMAAGDETEDTFKSLDSTIKELSRNIERIFRDPQRYQSFFHAFIGGFQKGILLSPQFIKTMRSTQDAIAAVERYGKRLGETFLKAFPGINNLFSAIQGFLDINFIQQRLEAINNRFSTFFDKVSDPRKIRRALVDLFNGLSKDFFGQWSSQSENMILARNSIKSFGTTVGLVIIHSFDLILKQATKVFIAFTDWIKKLGTDDEISFAKAIEKQFGITGSGGVFATIAESFGPALSDLWKTITEEFGPAFWEFTKVSLEKIKPHIVPVLGAIIGTVFSESLDLAWDVFKSIDSTTAQAAIVVAFGALGATAVAQFYNGFKMAAAAIKWTWNTLFGGPALDKAAMEAGKQATQSYKKGLVQKTATRALSAVKFVGGAAKAVLGAGALASTATLAGGLVLGGAGVKAIWGESDRKNLEDMWGERLESIYGKEAAESAIKSATNRHLLTGRMYYSRNPEKLLAYAEEKAKSHAEKHGVEIQIPEKAATLSADKVTKELDGDAKVLKQQLNNQEEINEVLIENLRKLENQYEVIKNVDIKDMEKALKDATAKLPTPEQSDEFIKKAREYVSQVNNIVYSLNHEFSVMADLTNTSLSSQVLSETSARINFAVGDMERLQERLMNFSGNTIATENFNVRLEEINEAIQKISEIYTTYTEALPNHTMFRINSLIDKIEEMETGLASLTNNKKYASVINVGKDLTGNSTIRFKHENLNLNLQVKVEMSAEQIANGIIKLDKVNGEDFHHNFSIGRQDDEKL